MQDLFSRTNGHGHVLDSTPLSFRNVALRIKTLRFHRWKAKPGATPLAVYSAGFSDGEKGPSAEALRKWSQRAMLPQQETLAEMCDVINTRFVLQSEMTLRLLADQTPFAEFVAALGLTELEAINNSFSLWAQDNDLCATFKFAAGEQMEAFGRSLPGLYEIERHGLGSDLHDTIAMAVFAPVPASLRQKETKLFVPCVLTVRSRNTDSLFWYHGVVASMDAGVEWRFFEEGECNLDRMNMMTGKTDVREEPELRGCLVTLTQSPASHPMACDVLFRRKSGPAALEAITTFLETVPSVTHR